MAKSRTDALKVTTDPDAWKVIVAYVKEQGTQLINVTPNTLKCVKTYFNKRKFLANKV